LLLLLFIFLLLSLDSRQSSSAFSLVFFFLRCALSNSLAYKL
jgi:hypothetical protein